MFSEDVISQEILDNLSNIKNYDEYVNIYKKLEDKAKSKIRYVDDKVKIKNTMIYYILEVMLEYMNLLIKNSKLSLFKMLKFYIQIIYLIDFIPRRNENINIDAPSEFFIFPELLHPNKIKDTSIYMKKSMIWSLIENRMTQGKDLPFVPYISKKYSLYSLFKLMTNNVFPVIIDIEELTINKIIREINKAKHISSVNISKKYNKIIAIENKEIRDAFLYVLYHEMMNGNVCSYIILGHYPDEELIPFFTNHKYSKGDLINTWRNIVYEYCKFMGIIIERGESLYNIINRCYNTNTNLTIQQRLDMIDSMNNMINKSNKEMITKYEDYFLFLYLISKKQYDCLFYIYMINFEKRYLINVNKKMYMSLYIPLRKLMLKIGTLEMINNPDKYLGYVIETYNNLSEGNINSDNSLDGFVLTKEISSNISIYKSLEGEIVVKKLPHSKRARKEIYMLKKLMNININCPEYISFYIDLTSDIIITKYINAKDLVELFVKDADKVSNSKFLLSLSKWLFKTVRELHNNNIVHCDIKLDNILYDGYSFYLIDFSHAHSSDINSKYYFNGNIRGTASYTSNYIASIILEKKTSISINTIKYSDIWASFITIYYLAYNDIVFKGKNITETYNKIVSNYNKLDTSLLPKKLIKVYEAIVDNVNITPDEVLDLL